MDGHAEETCPDIWRDYVFAQSPRSLKVSFLPENRYAKLSDGSDLNVGVIIVEGRVTGEMIVVKARMEHLHA